MAGPKVKLKDQLGRVVRLGGDSAGATVGKDLRWPDGSLVKSAEIRNPADAGGTGPAATVWKLIREVPANLQKLAKLAGLGFATRDAAGEWHQRSITAGEGVQVNDGDGVAGDPVVGLAELTDAGGGTLQKTARDSYGRLVGTSSADTGDLPEGSNLYFTDARAAVAAPVQSVNGKAGNVVLAPADVGLASGTAKQIWRGDGVLSNEIQGPIRIVENPAAPGMLSGLFGPYVAGSDGSPTFGMYDAFGQGAGLLFRRCNGTAATPTALTGNALIGQFQARGHDGEGYSSSETVAVWFEADGAWSAASHPGRISFFTTPAGSASPVRRLVLESGGAISPGADNTQSLGMAPRRYSVVYAGTGTINTSDEREKTPVRMLMAAELAAAVELGGEIGAYQWLAMIEQKGNAARQHIGMTVQGAIAVLESHGLDPFAYGFICYDQWDELPEIRDEWPALPQVVDDFGAVVQEAQEAGYDVVQEYRAAGDRYSFRMDELLAFIAAGQQARILAIEQQLAALTGGQVNS